MANGAVRVALEDSIVSDCRADYGGGGLEVRDGNVTLIRSRVVNCSAVQVSCTCRGEGCAGHRNASIIPPDTRVPPSDCRSEVALLWVVEGSWRCTAAA